MGPAAPMPSASPYMQPPTGPTVLDPMMQNTGNMGSSGPYGTPLQPMQPSQPMVNSGFNNGGMPMQNQQYGYTSPSPQPQQPPPQYSSVPGAMPTGGPFGGQTQQTRGGGGQFPQFTMFQQPIVQDMAMEYGQRLADQGKLIVENQFSKWIPVAKLKYYFAVDNNYVINKLRLLFFPFTHKVSFYLT